MKMSLKVVSALICFAIAPLCALAYNGEMINFEMNNSKMYPGTARRITVYVPKE